MTSNLKSIHFKHSYKSYGDDNIASNLIVPALKCSVLYRRSVGFFSSSVFELIIDGIVQFVRNHGKIELVASPELSEEDIAAIDAGYKERESGIFESFSQTFIEELEKLDDEKLTILAELIAKGFLDIKIAVTNNEHHIGIYHDKLGIFEDAEGNRVVFYGSSNSSKSGYEYNYEKVRVEADWIEGRKADVEDEVDEFELLWNNKNPYLDVYLYTEHAQQDVQKTIRKKKENGKKEPIELRDYQKEAIQAWVNNGYHGFFVMATGTGKTWTSIFAAKELIKTHPCILVICAPYKHLIKQWVEDLEKTFDDSTIIMVSSENPDWENQIRTEIISRKYGEKKQLIITSTIKSFETNRFKTLMSESIDEKMLIVDEAHNFKNLDENITKTFKYILGLSATPYSGKSMEFGKALMNFFGGKVYELQLEEALGRFLVQYNYYPIYVNAEPEGERKFKTISAMIPNLFNARGKCTDPNKLAELLRSRLRIISMAQEKMQNINTILDQIKEKDHFVVYCGDGRLFDNDTGNEIRHISAIKKVLDQRGLKASQFTANEDMNLRMKLIDLFNKGQIDVLAAIRCLDEGVDIPSIHGALILSSNDNYREFVQRRGRILRQYEGKNQANIYDVIVLPSYETTKWAEIEFRRFYEYARLALNKDELMEELEDKCEEYGLSIDTLDKFEYEEDVEEETDE